MKLYSVSEIEDSPAGSLLYTNKAEAIAIAKAGHSGGDHYMTVTELQIANLRLPELLCAVHNHTGFAHSSRVIWENGQPVKEA